MDDLMPKVEEDIFLEKTQEEDTLMEKPQEKGQVGSICDDQMLLILRTRVPVLYIYECFSFNVNRDLCI